MRYRLYTEEKVLYYADSNDNGLHVSVNERRGTTLRGLIKSLMDKKMITKVDSKDKSQVDEHYQTTLLGKVFLKVFQLEYAKCNGKNYDGLYNEITNLINDAMGSALVLDVLVLLISANENTLDAKAHKGDMAMRMINRMGLLKSDNLSVRGKILLAALSEEGTAPY